jgi:uncharacterized membrane protein YagU involved in acid resistance
MKKDRLTYGFIAGFLGALVPFIINFGSRALEFNTLVWSDFLSLYIMGRKPETALEMAFFIGSQFVFLGLLGSIFALALPLVTSKHHLFKGALYGIAVWFLLFSLPFLLKLPELQDIPLQTAVTHLVSSLVWGMSLALILKKIDSRVSRV